MHTLKLFLHGGGDIKIEVSDLADALNQTRAFLKEQEVDLLPVADIINHAYLDGEPITAGLINVLALAERFRADDSEDEAPICHECGALMTPPDGGGAFVCPEK